MSLRRRIASILLLLVLTRRSSASAFLPPQQLKLSSRARTPAGVGPAAAARPAALLGGSQKASRVLKRATILSPRVRPRGAFLNLGATVAPVPSTLSPKSSNGTDAAAAGAAASAASSLPGVTAKSNSKKRKREEQEGSAGAADNNSSKSGAFLDELRRLAEHAGDPQHNPIAAASRVEDHWRRHRRAGDVNVDGDAEDYDADEDADVAAFNVVLKAWRDCSVCLAENEVRFEADDGPLLAPESGGVAGVVGGGSLGIGGGAAIITPVDAASHALRLLTERLAEHEDGSSGIGIGGGGVDTTSHNLVMDAFVKSRHRSAFERATAVFEIMTTSTAATATTATTPDDSDDNSGTTEGRGRDGRRHRSRGRGCTPDVVTWNNLLEAAAYAPGENRLEVLEDLWSQMQRGSCRPNTRTVNTVLNAYSRPDRGTAAAGGRKVPTDWEGRAERCEEAFRAMSDHPDATTYTNLMTVHARRGTVKGAERAEALFHELRQRHEASAPGKDRYRPTVHAYASVMNAWASVQDPQAPAKAEEWLQLLLGDPTVSPNTKCYNACLQAWSRSSDPARTAKALALLQQMKKDPSTAPNRASYLAALWACNVKNGTPLQQTAALKVAFAVFRSAELDALHHGLYATLLRVVSALLPPDSAHGERDDVSTAVFRKAVRDGRVTSDVLRALQQATSAGAFHSVLVPSMVGEHGEILFHKIPPAWSKHAR